MSQITASSAPLTFTADQSRAFEKALNNLVQSESENKPAAKTAVSNSAPQTSHHAMPDKNPTAGDGRK